MLQAPAAVLGTWLAPLGDRLRSATGVCPLSRLSSLGISKALLGLAGQATGEDTLTPTCGGRRAMAQSSRRSGGLEPEVSTCLGQERPNPTQK